MTDRKIERKKLAIFDPKTEMFLSTDTEIWRDIIQWTDMFSKVMAYVQIQSILPILKAVRVRNPDAQLVEVMFSMTWEPVTNDVSPEERHATFVAEKTAEHLVKQREVYETLLPAFKADAEAMPKKDWERFKRARGALRSAGYEVEMR